MSSKYRIIQQPGGQVHVEKLVTCLYFFSSWQPLGYYQYAGLEYPQYFRITDHLTAACAKDAIDQLLKHEEQCSQPPIITPYPPTDSVVSRP